MIGFVAFRTGHHGDGVAAEVLVEAAGLAAAHAHGGLVHGHRVVVVVVVAAELQGELVSGVCLWMGGGEKGRHTMVATGY